MLAYCCHQNSAAPGLQFKLPHVCVQEAAQQLKVGLSVLKRICRQMGLVRWPYRTRQSLRGVIAKTEQYYRVRDTSQPLGSLFPPGCQPCA